MSLPISKTALDRLGGRLIASDSISGDDLAELARVINAYQNVLNGVKLRLAELGYSATTRMKTTGTLVDKLKRETARLSQVQDLAGARIIVPDRAAQDEAVDRIASAFGSAGCKCKVVDRRKNPSYGYRAIHVVVWVDGVPVEIQVRTDLQDSWAQLVERLADTWGRGIRYGEEPETLDAEIGGSEQVVSRLEVLSLVMKLSDTGEKVELRQAALAQIAKYIEKLLDLAARLERIDGGSNRIIGDLVPQEVLTSFEQAITSIQIAEMTALFAGCRRMTAAEFAEALRHSYEVARQDHERQEAEARSRERSLRDILGRLADAIGQE